jgi:hypothetical protein
VHVATTIDGVADSEVERRRYPSSTVCEDRWILQTAQLILHPICPTGGLRTWMQDFLEARPLMQGYPADHESGCDRKPLVESQIRTWNVNEVTPALNAACSFKEHFAYSSRTATDLKSRIARMEYCRASGTKIA